MIFHPPTVQIGELGSYFENANNLKGAHNKTCQTNSVEHKKWQKPQDTKGSCWLIKVKEHTDTTQTEAA